MAKEESIMRLKATKSPTVSKLSFLLDGVADALNIRNG